MPVDASTLGELAELSPHLKQRVIEMAELALDEAEHVLTYGTPAMKAPLVRDIMKMVTRPKADGDTFSDQLTRMREIQDAENQRLTQLMLGRGDDVDGNVIDAVIVTPDMVD